MLTHARFVNLGSLRESTAKVFSSFILERTILTVSLQRHECKAAMKRARSVSDVLEPAKQDVVESNNGSTAAPVIPPKAHPEVQRSWMPMTCIVRKLAVTFSCAVVVDHVLVCLCIMWVQGFVTVTAKMLRPLRHRISAKYS